MELRKNDADFMFTTYPSILFFVTSLLSIYLCPLLTNFGTHVTRHAFFAFFSAPFGTTGYHNERLQDGDFHFLQQSATNPLYSYAYIRYNKGCFSLC